ncbi:MAG: hypothetical protein R3F43_20970 [bacterium]
MLHARVRWCSRGASVEGVDAGRSGAGDLGGPAGRRRPGAAGGIRPGASLQNYVGQITRRKTLNALEHARGGAAAGFIRWRWTTRGGGGGCGPDVQVEERDAGAAGAHLQGALPTGGWLIFRLLRGRRLRGRGGRRSGDGPGRLQLAVSASARRPRRSWPPRAAEAAVSR